jgi:hypothetical protein
MGSDKPIVDDFDNQEEDDELGTGLSILSFCIPLAGAIIYFSNKSDKPKKAEQACHAALWGVAAGFVLNIISYIIQAM